MADNSSEQYKAAFFAVKVSLLFCYGVPFLIVIISTSIS